MNFETLVRHTNQLPCFDLQLIAQLSGEDKRQLSQQLHRWARGDKVIALRRGLYTLDEAFGKFHHFPPGLANEIYKPSYLSCLWALSYYGLIPEKVATFTSVTTRVTREFNNDLGRFAYSTLKNDFFWGFHKHESGQNQFWLAEPEKALLDYWHLNSGEWSEARLIEMRFQNTYQLDLTKLLHYARKWGSPRLLKTIETFRLIHHENQKDYKEI